MENKANSGKALACKHCLGPIVLTYNNGWKHSAGQDPGTPDAHAAEPLFAADELLDSLRAKHAEAAAEASVASVDIAVHERKAEQARVRYDSAKTRRELLKRAIAAHPGT